MSEPNTSLQNTIPVAESGVLNKTQGSLLNRKWKAILITSNLVVLSIALGLLIYNFSITNIVKYKPFVSGTAYEGTWETPGYPALPAKLTILSIDGQKAIVHYQWGGEDDLDVIKGERQMTFNILPNNAIALSGSDNQRDIIFTHINDDSIQGKRIWNGLISKITMSKVNE